MHYFLCEYMSKKSSVRKTYEFASSCKQGAVTVMDVVAAVTTAVYIHTLEASDRFSTCTHHSPHSHLGQHDIT